MKIQVVNKSDFELPAYATVGSAGMDVRADMKRYMIERGIGIADGDGADPQEIVGPVMELAMEPHQQYVIPTGLFFALPEGGYDPTVKEVPFRPHLMSDLTELHQFGWEIEVRPRSGLAAKYGVTVLNSPGTLDNDYRGELKIILICHNHNGYVVKHGERIAQILIKKYIKADFEVVDSLDETERGEGGLGHTGKH